MNQDLMEELRSGTPLSRRQQIRLIFHLSWPAIVAQLSSIAMQYIDASMVGRLGSNESAAIGLVATTTWLFMDLIFAITTGFHILVAQQLGARNNAAARNIMGQGFAFSMGLALVLTVSGSVVAEALPRWLGAESAIWTDASVYFLIFSLFVPTLALNYLCSGMLRSSGNMKVPGIAMVAMCFLDVVFNALLIFPTGTLIVFGLPLPGCDLGVLGAALGTALAQTISALFLLYWLLLCSPELRLRKDEKLVFSLQQITQSLHISLPIAAEKTVMALARMATTVIVAPLGIIAIAANSFGITIEALCYMPGYGIQAAASTLVGQSIGARRHDITYPLARLTVGLGMAVMALGGLLMYIFAPQMMALLTLDPDVIALGTQVLRIEAFSEPFFAAFLVAGGAFQGSGRTLMSTVLTATTMWGIRVPLAALLAPHWGLHGVWFAMAFQLTICGILLLIRLRRKRWLPEDFRNPS